MFDRDYPGKGKKVAIIGIPLGFGAGKRGSGLGTRTIRQANVRGRKLTEHIEDLGYQVHDYEDL
ncbi:MAG TPA: hypothetical protein PKY82_32285, partial [Pyrinomonadaceae bacterium]|nr:hypothetical protein [Pyrinomonadaceae bacterium]